MLWPLRIVTAIVISRSYLPIYEKTEAFDRPITPIGVPGADMTTAIAAHDPVDKDAADGHDDLLLAFAKVNANGCPRGTVHVESIVRAAITSWPS